MAEKAIANPPLPATDPKATLDTVIAAARMAEPVITGPDDKRHVLIPPGFSLKELPDADRLPIRPAQWITVDDRASLSNYANRFSARPSIIIADFDAGEIGAHLDWHPDNQDPELFGAGACTHSVILKLRLSEEFQRWDAMEGDFHEQAEFARFLEENSVDVGYPEAATMIEIARDFEASSSQHYKQTVRLDNGDRQMVFKTESNAENGVVVPQKFTLSIPIYNGEQPDTLTCLFRWRPTGSGSVRLGFQWHRVEYLRRAHFAQIAATAAEETGLPHFMGRIRS